MGLSSKKIMVKIFVPRYFCQEDSENRSCGKRITWWVGARLEIAAEERYVIYTNAPLED